MIFSFGRSQFPVYSAIGIVDMDERKPRYLNAEGLWNYALRALGGRAHSTGEMREKLVRRAERAEDVEKVLARLKESKYLDDRQFAEGYDTARLSNERFGKTRALQDLMNGRRAPAIVRAASRGVGTPQTESLTESLRHGGGLRQQARSGEAEFFHYAAADQVLLDDALQHVRGRGVIQIGRAHV